MESLITSYGIDYTKFRNIIISTNSIVSGSSALACYLTQEGIEPGFIVGDIDIWIPYQRDTYVNIHIFRDFLLSSGFLFDENSFKEYGQYSSLPYVTDILTFINSKSQKVQLIEIREIVPSKYIRRCFDLSICSTWWDAQNEIFKTTYPCLTKKKQFMYMRTSTPTYKDVMRMQKYKARGFEFIDTACPINVQKDERVELDSNKSRLCAVEAFDVIEFDNVNVINYLKASEWNIILKVKDILYAFKRKELIKMMRDKKTNISSLNKTIVDTPFHQSVHVMALSLLGFGDYSIYELEYSNCIEYRDSVKSIYDMKCYSVKGYISGTPSMIVYGPTIIKKLVCSVDEHSSEQDSVIT